MSGFIENELSWVTISLMTINVFQNYYYKYNYNNNYNYDYMRMETEDPNQPEF